jgi:hypothetical protein
MQDAMEALGHIYMSILQDPNMTNYEYEDACEVMYELYANAKAFFSGRWRWK